MKHKLLENIYLVGNSSEPINCMKNLPSATAWVLISPTCKKMENDLQVYIKWLNSHSITAENTLMYCILLRLWYTVQENTLPVGRYWESQRGGGSSPKLAMRCDNRSDEKCNWVGHQTLSCAQRWFSTRHFKKHPFEFNFVHWGRRSFARRAETDWWLQLWGFPLPRMQSGKEVLGNGLKTGNSITGVDSMVESFALSRCTWPHTRLRLAGSPFTFQPSAKSHLKTTLLGVVHQWKCRVSIEITEGTLA